MRRRTIIIATVLMAVVIITMVVSSGKLVAAFEKGLFSRERAALLRMRTWKK